MSSGNNDKDSDDYHLSYDGERGPKWRKFSRDLLARARGKYSKDDRYAWSTAFLKMDEGGTAQGAPPMPVNQAPLVEAQRKQVRRCEVAPRGSPFPQLRPDTWMEALR